MPFNIDALDRDSVLDALDKDEQGTGGTPVDTGKAEDPTPVDNKATDGKADDKVDSKVDDKVEDKSTEDKDKDNDKDADKGTVDDDTTVEEASVIDSLIEDLGFTPAEGRKYEESRQGAALLVNDIATQKAQAMLNEYIESVPGLKSYHEFLQNGGDPTAFIKVAHPTVDYSKLSLDTADNKRLVVRNHLIDQGMTSEKAAEILEKYETSGILDTMADTAKAIMAKKQEDEKARILKEQADNAKAAKEANDKYWSNVIETVNKSSAIKGINIPIKDKEDFIKYMAIAADEKNRSQWMIDIDNDKQDIETTIALAYIRYKKLDLSALIAAEARTQAAAKTKYSYGKQANENPKNVGSDKQGKIDLNSNILEELWKEDERNKQTA